MWQREMTDNKVKDIIQTYKSIPDDVKSFLELSGIKVEDESAKPTFNGSAYNGSIPNNLDSLDTGEIAELMAAHISWTRYVNGALSDAIAKLKCYEEALSAVKSYIIKHKGKDSLEFDEDYISANYNVTWWSTTKTYLESVSSACSHNYKVISRVITLRGIDHEQNVRASSVKKGFENGRQSRRSSSWVSNSED
jgi:hypothetical protein